MYKNGIKLYVFLCHYFHSGLFLNLSVLKYAAEVDSVCVWSIV